MSEIDRFILVRKHFTTKQGDFAELLEINQQSISDIERGKKKIQYEILEKIGKLGINLNWLLSGFGEMFVKENSVGVQKISGTINGHSNVVGNNNTVHNDGDLMKIEFLEKEVAGLKRENETLRELVDVLKKKE